MRTLIRYYQDVKFGVNMLRYKLYGHRFPAHVAIAVTNRCNLKCPYCFYGYTLYKEDKVTTRELFYLIDELCRRGTAYINLNGGEPLLRKDIGEIVDRITGKGMRCSVSTNAILLEDRIEELKKANVSVLNISLDGNEEQHRKNRGDISYAKVIKGIDAAHRHDIPVAICTVLTKDNKDCVDEIVRLAKDKGVYSIFHFLYERLDPKDAEPNQLTREEEIAIMDKIIAYKKQGYPVHYSDRIHEYIKKWPIQGSRLMLDGNAKQAKDDKDFRIIPCVAGDLYTWIDANGKFCPCAVLSGQVNAQSFAEVGFEKAWNEVPKNRCQSCSFFHQAEMNMLFSLELRGWLDIVSSKFIRP